ncbi:MAG: ABC transporter ATP-binding protein [Pseudomonadota bacterium]
MKILELVNITKRFGPVVANDNLSLDVEKGEVHCVLGENGAGKTTLMKILFGLYALDHGRIFLKGHHVNIQSPRQAISLGIGMIHQDFMLVDRLSVTENIIAGCEPRKGIFLDKSKARKEVQELSEKYGLRLNPDAIIEDISVGEQQRVEILKVLYRNADLLILDEPTSVLTPHEVEELFAILRKLKKDGETILFITHKLKETMAVSDRITVLRDGKKVGTVNTSETNPAQLAKMMVGRDVILRVNKKEKQTGKIIFQTRHLYATNRTSHLTLKDLHLTIREGEIVGIAGVEGNGQMELEEVLMGLREIDQGEIILNGRNITQMSTAERRALGMVHIPSDRLKRGLIRTQDIEKNLLLGQEWNPPFSKKGILSRSAIERHSQKVIHEFGIHCSSSKEKIDSLSGGNQQRVVIGRELSRDPKMIVAAQPTRGIDIGAVEYIHNALLRMRDQNSGILLFSTDLDELFSLSDRILIIYEGEIIAEGSDFSEEELGLLMAGHKMEGTRDVTAV